mgnify:CR=1 FL=1
MKIACLGPKESFSEKAALKAFSNSEIVVLPTIRHVIESVESGKYEFGIVPLENFYNGIVMQTVDSLTECNKTKIIDEIYLNIKHCIGILPECKRIDKILSHQQALEQCAKYLALNYSEAETTPTESTAGAAKIIKEKNMLNAAAIASKSALESQGLKILAEDILPNNNTRFGIIGFNLSAKTGKDKLLLSIYPKIDKAGTLFNILKYFAEANINIRHIHSRPDGKGKYYFILEIDGHEKDDNVMKSLSGIRKYLESEKSVKILGNYPNRAEK